MSLYRDTGVVLRVHKLGEADRIITLLTRRFGKVRAVAKGVRRTTSRFGARVEPFCHVDVQLHTGRTLDVITQVQTLDAFGVHIVDDYQRYTAGCAVLETVDRLAAEEGEPVLRLYLLVTGALRALSGRERDPSLVLDAFLLRAMSYAGWAPALSECARCGEAGPHAAFNVQGGGAMCVNCRPTGSARPAQQTLPLLEALMHGDWPAAERTTEQVRREGSGLVAAHLQWHLERQLRSLPLVERQEHRPVVPELIRERAAAVDEEPTAEETTAAGSAAAESAAAESAVGEPVAGESAAADPVHRATAIPGTADGATG